MFRFLEHTQIDKQKWDTVVAQSIVDNSLVYSYCLDQLCPNWSALVEDDYKSILALCTAKKWGISYIYQPPFIAQLGFLNADPSLNEPLTGLHWRSLLEVIPSRFKTIHLDLLSSSVPLSLKTLVNNSSKISKNKLYQLAQLQTLDLTISNNLLSNYSENAKRNLKKAAKSQLILNKKADLKQIIELFLNTKGKSIEGIRMEHFSRLEQLHLKLTHQSLSAKSHCWAVHHSDGTLLCGALFLEGINEDYFLFSGTHPKGRETQAMTYLIHQYLVQSTENRIFHFNGSNDANLARFYAGFGAQSREYFHLQINRLPRIIKWLKS